MSVYLFGPALTLGDILVIIAYTQKPHLNLDADISSGDRSLNSTTIYHLHSCFTLANLYNYYTQTGRPIAFTTETNSAYLGSTSTR